MRAGLRDFQKTREERADRTIGKVEQIRAEIEDLVRKTPKGYSCRCPNARRSRGGTKQELRRRRLNWNRTNIYPSQLDRSMIAPLAFQGLNFIRHTL